MADGEARNYLFTDDLENGASAWNSSGGAATISSEGEPALGGSGSSLKLIANAWSQTGVFSFTTVSDAERYLHLDIYRAPGSDGQLVLRHGNGWSTIRLDDSNYGLWTIDGVDNAEDLSAIPLETWAHVTIDLVGLLGSGATLNAFGVFGYYDSGNTYFVDEIYLSNTASTGGGGGNAAPVATDDSYSTNEDAELTVPAAGVLANDTDSDGDALTAVLQTGPANGALTLNANGSFTYTPNANFNGADSFTYVANDGTDDSAPVTVNINVAPVNDAPVASNMSFTLSEDGSVQFLTPGVLRDATDAEGDALAAILREGPANGVLNLNADGSFTYAPNDDFYGTDSFTFVASDGQDESEVATVSITVSSVNDLPVVRSDNYTTTADATLTIPATGVLANDTDADGDVLSALLNSGPQNGTLTLNADGSFAYTPNGGFVGEDTFTYRASDGTATSPPVTVRINVTAGNSAPVAAADSYALNEDATLTIFPVGGVLANDTDANGDALSASLVSGPANGLLTFNADGSFAYSPNANFNGTDSFTYVANDGTTDSAPATVTINVAPVNDAPVATGEFYQIYEEGGINAAQGRLLANDVDADGDVLTAVLLTVPPRGQFGFNGAQGSFVYNAEPNFNGTVTFSYAVSDGQSTSDPVTVEINVAPVAAPPEIIIGDTQSLTPLDAVDIQIGAGPYGGPSNASISALPEGGFVIVRTHRGDAAIVQRYDEAGSPVGPSIQANTTDGVSHGSVAALSDGGFVVSWTNTSGLDGDGNGVFLQRFDSAGQQLGREIQVNSFTAGTQKYPNVVTLADGGYVVVWTSIGQDGAAGGVYSQRFSADGQPIGDEIRVNTTTYQDEFLPSVAALQDGGFVVAWASYGNGETITDVYAQRFDAAGQQDGVETLVNTTTAGVQIGPSIAALADGGYVIVWRSLQSPGNYAQHYDSDGIPVGGETLVSAYASVGLEDPSAVGLPDGGYVVTWAEWQIDGSGYGTYAQRMDANGSPLGQAVRINAETAGNQYHDANDSGNGLITTTDGMLVQVFGTPGVPYFRRFQIEDQADVDVNIDAIENTSVMLQIFVSSPEPAESVSSVVLAGFPPGSTLSAGVSDGDGTEWSFTASPPSDLTFTPPPNFTGAFELTVTATTVDGASTATTSAAIDVVVAPTATTAPAAAADTFSTDEDVSLVVPAGGVLANDSDADSDPVTAVLQSGPSFGALTLNADGSFVYTPDADFSGTDSFVYVANDGSLNSDPTTVTITVNPVNDPPVAQDDVYVIGEDEILFSLQAGNVLDNDSDVENGGSGLSTSWATDPLNGTVSVLSQGTFFYTPDPNYSGTETLVYVVTDSDGATDEAEVRITINPVAAPAEIVFGDTQSITPLDSDAIPFMADQSGNQRAPSIAELSEGGFVALWQGFETATGVQLYIQRFDADGVAVGEAIRVSDSDRADSGALVQLADGGFVATWVNHAPGSLEWSVYQQRLDSDLQPVGDQGALYSDASGRSIYDVSPLALSDGGYLVTWVGTDSVGQWGVFAQRLDASGAPQGDTTLVSSSAIRLEMDPDAVLLDDGGYVIAWNSYGQGTLSEIYAQRFDVDGQPIGGEFTVNTMTGPVQQQHTSIAKLADGGFVVSWAVFGTPEIGHSIRAQKFDADGQAVGDEVVVATLGDHMPSDTNVIGLPDGGYLTTWTSSRATGDRGISQDGSGAGVFGQRVGAEGELIGQVVRVSAESAGDQLQGLDTSGQGLILTADGTLVQVYEDRSEPVFRRFTIEDAADVDTAFYGVEDASIPLVMSIASPDSNETVSEVVLSGLPVGSVLSAGTPNADGSEWTFSGSPPADLSLTPPLNFNGTFVLTVTATTVDGASTATTSANVNVIVAPVNDVPVVVQETADQTAQEGELFTLVLPEVIFTDADGDDLPMSVTQGNYAPLPDWLSYDAETRTLSGTPGDGDGGQLSVRLQVNDGNGGVAFDYFYITVDAPPPFNTPPVAFADAYATNEDTALTIAAPGILSNDTDVEGDTLSVSMYALPTNGTLNWSTTGSFTYTPNANFNGTDQFIYRAFDGTDLSDPVAVTIDVAAVNDAPIAAADAATGQEGSPTVIDVLANDSDVDGDALTISQIQGQAIAPGGSVAIGTSTVALNADNTLTVTPGEGSAGNLDFTYAVTDGTETTTGNVSVIVEPGSQQVREYVFSDSLENGAVVWNTGGSNVGTSADGDPVEGGFGSSLKVVVNAWSQGGLYRGTTVDDEHAFLHFDVYRAPGSDGELVLRHGNGWTTEYLNDANYGLWTIEGVDAADDLSAIPVETWTHVTINLTELIGAGANLNAFGIFGFFDAGNTYFLDNIYFADSAAAPAAQSGGAGATTMMTSMERAPDTFDFSAMQTDAPGGESYLGEEEMLVLNDAMFAMDEELGSFDFSNATAVSSPGIGSALGAVNQPSAHANAFDPGNGVVDLFGGPNLEALDPGAGGLLGSDALVLE